MRVRWLAGVLVWYEKVYNTKKGRSVVETRIGKRSAIGQ
jgi:hypothetical protein